MTNMRNSFALQELLGRYCNFAQLADVAQAANNSHEFCVYLSTKSILVEVKNTPSGVIISLRQNVRREVLEGGGYEASTGRFILWVT